MIYIYIEAVWIECKVFTAEAEVLDRREWKNLISPINKMPKLTINNEMKQYSKKNKEKKWKWKSHDRSDNNVGLRGHHHPLPLHPPVLLPTKLISAPQTTLLKHSPVPTVPVTKVHILSFKKKKTDQRMIQSSSDNMVWQLYFYTTVSLI